MGTALVGRRTVVHELLDHTTCSAVENRKRQRFPQRTSPFCSSKESIGGQVCSKQADALGSLWPEVGNAAARRRLRLANIHIKSHPRGNNTCLDGISNTNRPMLPVRHKFAHSNPLGQPKQCAGISHFFKIVMSKLDFHPGVCHQNRAHVNQHSISTSRRERLSCVIRIKKRRYQQLSKLCRYSTTVAQRPGDDFAGQSCRTEHEIFHHVWIDSISSALASAMVTFRPSSGFTCLREGSFTLTALALNCSNNGISPV
jgi:hypothetical protein